MTGTTIKAMVAEAANPKVTEIESIIRMDTAYRCVWEDFTRRSGIYSTLFSNVCEELAPFAMEKIVRDNIHDIACVTGDNLLDTFAGRAKKLSGLVFRGDRIAEIFINLIATTDIGALTPHNVNDFLNLCVEVFKVVEAE